MKDAAHFLEIAREAAALAAARLKQGLAVDKKVNFQDARDIKLQADLESEAIVRKHLSAHTDFPLIGEEGGGDASLYTGDEPYWVIDPLDGTFNYERDLPLCCVSIGLWRGDRPILGVIHDFNLNEVFAAIVPLEGNPGIFTINGEAVIPRWAERLELANLLTGYTAYRDYSPEAMEHSINLMKPYKKVRMLGTAALAAAYVAAGRADVNIEESLKLWDAAAALAMVEAVGGTWLLKPVDLEKLTFDIYCAGKREFLPNMPTL